MLLGSFQLARHESPSPGALGRRLNTGAAQRPPQVLAVTVAVTGVSSTSKVRTAGWMLMEDTVEGREEPDWGAVPHKALDTPRTLKQGQASATAQGQVGAQLLWSLTVSA